jgi:non-specific serine/threonine protein kinase
VAAEQASSRFPDGVYFADLSVLREAAQVSDAVASAVEAPEDPAVPAARRVVEALGSRRVLLMLDNCEHLLDAAASLASEIVEACPAASVLATSRSALGAAGEREWTVPPMAVPGAGDRLDSLESADSVRLFVERAQDVRGGFRLTPATGPAVALVVGRLDGLPLAIELAAAWIRVLGPQQIAERLDERLRLLSRGLAGAPERHQTLRAAIDWSHELLTSGQRALFAAVAVFAGTFDIDAVEAVCGRDVLDSLYDLVRANLIVAEPVGDRARYRLLETIREYALERLRETGDEPALHARHLTWFADRAEALDSQLSGPQERDSLDAMDRDHANYASAIDWSLSAAGSPDGLRLASALVRFWERRGHVRQGSAWIEAALEAAAGPPASHRARALTAAGDLAWDLMEFEVAKERYEAALDLHRQLRDETGLAGALLRLGNLVYQGGDLDRAGSLYEESIAIARALSLADVLPNALNNLALLRQDQERYELSRDLQLEALANRREQGSPSGVALTLSNLGTLERRVQNWHEARRRFEEALVLFRSIGNEERVALSLHNIGVVAGHAGDTALARSMFEKAADGYRRLGLTLPLASELIALAGICRDRGEMTVATSAVTEALSVCLERGKPEEIAETIEVIAGIAAWSGATERAARLLGAADILREAHAAPRTQACREEVDAIVRRASAMATPESFRRARSEGRLMSLDEAAEYAREPIRGHPMVFTREGDAWTIVHRDNSVRVRDTSGMGYLAELVREPGKEVHVLELIGHASHTGPGVASRAEMQDAGLSVDTSGDAGQALDQRALDEYRRRLRDLEEDLEEAESFRDLDRAAQARAERDALLGELEHAAGLGGRPRRAGSDIERARLNVTRAIRTAIRAIGRHDAALAHHLDESVRTGTYCSYAPG